MYYHSCTVSASGTNPSLTIAPGHPIGILLSFVLHWAGVLVIEFVEGIWFQLDGLEIDRKDDAAYAGMYNQPVLV